MEERICTFCGNPIEPGTGSIYVKRDGTVHNFCSSKCRKNLLANRRVPRRVRWTRFFVKGSAKVDAEKAGKAAKRAAPAPKAAAPKASAAEKGS